jgi:hypothetical protein
MKSINIVSVLMATLVHGGVSLFPSSSHTSSEDSNVPAPAIETNLSTLKKTSWLSSSVSTSSDMTRRYLQKGKKGGCPDVLKQPKKGKLYMKCEREGDPVYSVFCSLYPYDGETVPETDPLSAVMIFQGIFHSNGVDLEIYPYGYISGNLITGAVDKKGDDYAIIVPISGMSAVTEGGISEFPIVNAHTLPVGKGLCGVDKISFIRLNNTSTEGETILTAH